MVVMDYICVLELALRDTLLTQLLSLFLLILDGLNKLLKVRGNCRNFLSLVKKDLPLK